MQIEWLSSRNSIGHVIRLKIPLLNSIFENENGRLLHICLFAFGFSRTATAEERAAEPIGKSPARQGEFLKNSFFIFLILSHLLYNSFAFGHIIIAAGVFTRRKPPPVDRDRPLPQQRREFTVNQDF